MLLAAVVIRPACLVFQTLMRTPTPKWIKSFGGSPAFLGTRSRAIWNILDKRAEGVPVTQAKFRRPNPRRSGQACDTLAERTQAGQPNACDVGQTNPRLAQPK